SPRSGLGPAPALPARAAAAPAAGRGGTPASSREAPHGLRIRISRNDARNVLIDVAIVKRRDTHAVARVASSGDATGPTPPQPSAATSSASCTALSAAPLRMLSETIHRLSPRGCERSSRILPT